MASHLIPSVSEHPQYTEWARLIPGELPAIRRAVKKPPQSVRQFEERRWAASALPRAAERNAFSLLLPKPLRGGRAKEWLQAVTLDFGLIAMNWFLLGAMAILLRPLAGTIPFWVSGWSPVLLLGVSILHASLFTLIAYTEGLYAANVETATQVRTLAKAILLSTSVLCIAYLLQGAPWNIAFWLCAAGSLHFGVLWVWRCVVTRERNDSGKIAGRNVLVIGAGPLGERISSYIEDHPACGRRMCGFLDDERPLGNGVVGRIRDLAILARRGFVDELILAAPREQAQTVRLLREAKRLHLDVQIIPDLFGCNLARGDIEQFGDLPVISVHAERLPAGGLALKRIIDVAGAAVGLLVLAPLLLLISALIKMDSSGPVLYIAQRAGRKGRLFRCYKFRTMVSDADGIKDSLRHKNERSGPLFKIAEDPRITRVGRRLRRYSLDELPQLWNVLRGEMSLVGPRPHPLDDFDRYELGHLGRLDVTPGLTGLWQVSARRESSFDRAMDLDREYIRNWSLGLDLRILLRTVSAVAQGSGN